VDGVIYLNFAPRPQSHFLVYDSLIESVIFARDKYLAKGGIILPDRGVLFLSSIEDEEYKNKKMEFWYFPDSLFSKGTTFTVYP
jgi:hypothetical protein